MKRRGVFLAAVLVAAIAVVAAIAQAHTTRDARRASGSTVQLRETLLGKIVANSAGFTLFDFSKDKRNKDACQSVGGCTSVWPPLLTSHMPTAGSGLSASKLGTITLSNGKKQVTYYGRPLYLYTGDKNPGETSYVGASEFGGTWLAVNAKGASVKAKNSSKKEGEGGGGW